MSKAPHQPSLGTFRSPKEKEWAERGLLCPGKGCLSLSQTLQLLHGPEATHCRLLPSMGLDRPLLALGRLRLDIGKNFCTGKVQAVQSSGGAPSLEGLKRCVDVGHGFMVALAVLIALDDLREPFQPKRFSGSVVGLTWGGSALPISWL